MDSVCFGTVPQAGWTLGFPGLLGTPGLSRRHCLKPSIGTTDTTGMEVHTNQLLSRLLDVASLRHRVIAQNVANVNTPGYHQLDVQFEDAFTQALSAGDSTAALHVRPQVVENSTAPERADGNNVDIDVEIARLNKNTLLYRTFAQIIASHVATQRSAITGQ
jgi:flagellar basal-body rod protein FlgB